MGAENVMYTLLLCAQNGFVDLRVADDENLHYRFLVTTTSHPKGFAQTQVLLGLVYRG